MPPSTRPLIGPAPTITSPKLSFLNGTNSEPSDTHVSFEDGAMKIEHPDGSVTIDFNGKQPGPEEKGFKENLALHMDDGRLEEIANDLLEGIQRDIDSRKDWLDTRAMGITLLGIKLEKPKAEAGSATAPLEGMSTVRHPLLLGATITFQATARGELLPAAGPVKVRNDSPPPPLGQETNAAQDLADSLEGKDELSQALEKDMNHYLTHIATEYIPDTDRMLFYVGFGGDGFKKVYNCPLRNRPVSESVDAEDLIVSNAATDLQSCGRVTHRIWMRKSTLRRMQILGAYRDVDLQPPPAPQQNPVDKKKEELTGIRSDTRRAEDRDYEIFESYCELDLDEFAPKKFKGKGLPLPYRVTLEKESKKVLDIRRNWKEDDDQALAKHFFVQFPFIRGLGFYGLGFIHILGNTANALTGAWRVMLDAGMFASFPGFLFAKGAGRQNSNQFRVPPGGGIGLDIGAQQSIKDAIMPLPYKEVGPSFTAFITHVEEEGKKLAAMADVSVGEGKQDAPVGTTLALIEQAGKVMDSAHKRLHAAQAEEFKLLKERFREDPEAFWRHNKQPTIQWKKDQFTQALNNCELVPVADPNNPTSLHRIAKAMAIKNLQQASPDLYDPVAVDMRIMRIADIDPSGLFRATPAPPPPDPRMAAVSAKAQAEQQKNQIMQLEQQIKAATAQQTLADKQKDRESRERIEAMKIQLERLKLQQEQIIHAHDAQRDDAMATHEMQLDHVQKMQELHHDNLAKANELRADAISQQHEMRGGLIKSQQEIEMEKAKHRAEMERMSQEHSQKMARSAQEHEQKMRHTQEMHEANLAAARQLAKVKPKKEKKDGS